MAEIKSTMELVMEKLARMEKAAPDEIQGEEYEKEGMRRAAEYLRGEGAGLEEALAGRNELERLHLRRGMGRVFLRHILLPRDEEQVLSMEKAMAGLLELGKGRQDLAGMFEDMKNITGRYTQHRKQLRKQLEEAFEGQMAQMERTVAQQTGVSMRLAPAQHPKFQEEWQRLQDDLKEQYGRALDQYKQVIEERLSDGR